MKRTGVWCCCLLILGLSCLPINVHAQATPSSPAAASATSPELPKSELSKDVADTLSQLDHRVTAAQSSADNAWMLVSAALVLMMTGPGLALFYGGRSAITPSAGFVGPRSALGIGFIAGAFCFWVATEFRNNGRRERISV